MYVCMYVTIFCALNQGLRFPLARSPAASQNQLGRVKVICYLARLASEVYCITIIINNTNLINFYSFHLSFQYVIKRDFLEIMCLYSVHVYRDIHIG